MVATSEAAVFEQEVVGRALVSLDLPDTTASVALGRIRADELTDHEWGTLMRFVAGQRLEPALAWAIAKGAWKVDDERRSMAFDAHTRAMALTLLLERDLLDIGAALDAAGVAFRVLKGPALAHLDEPNPSMRAFGDIDLLVRGADIARAVGVIAAAGGHRRFAEPRRGFDERFTKGISFTFARNCEIDLHRTLTSGPFGLSIDLDELFAGTELLRIAGHDLLALDRASRFIHACFHGLLTGTARRLGTFRDIVHTAPRGPEELRTVLARAERWHAAPVIAGAVLTTRHELGWTPPAELAAWAKHVHIDARDRRWLASSCGEGRTYARQAMRGIEALHDPRDKLAYAIAITLPSTGGARATARRWRRGLRALRPVRS